MAKAKAPDRAIAGWISLKAAVEVVADQTRPQPDDLRRAKNAIRQKITYAENRGRFARRNFADRAYFVKQHFEFWAIQAWPELKLREVFKLPNRTLVNLTPELSLVELPPSVDRNAVVIPDDRDELKELYLRALQDLNTSNWLLTKCRAELAELVERDAAIRKKKSKAGKRGKGVPRRRQ